MSLTKYLVLFLAVLLLTSGEVIATEVNFQFIGTVTYGGSLAAIGEQITGVFSYDTDTLPSQSYSHNDMSHSTYSFSSQGISASVAGHKVTTNKLSVSITNNFGGNVEDSVDMSGGYPVFVDGVTYSNGSIGFNMASKPMNTDVLTDTLLPTSFDVKAFDAGPTSNYGWLQRDGAPDGRLLGFSIDSISSDYGAPHYVLNLSLDDGGTISVDPQISNNQYWAGILLTLTAMANEGWKFLRWEGNVSDTGKNITSIQMDKNQAVKAVFATSSGDTLTSPTISFDPTSLSISSTQGNNASDQTFQLWNSGSGTLNYSLSAGTDWITFAPSSGVVTGDHSMITVHFNSSNLTVGEYNQDITITSTDPDITNSPQTIPVQLSVTESRAKSNGGGGGGCCIYTDNQSGALDPLFLLLITMALMRIFRRVNYTE